MPEKPTYNPEEEIQQPKKAEAIPAQPVIDRDNRAEAARHQVRVEQAQRQDATDLAAVRATIAKTTENEEQNPDMPVPEQVKKLVMDLGENHHLIIHQTTPDTASDIIKANYFGITGLRLTALESSAEEILDTFGQLDRNYRGQGAKYGTTHKGANAAVIMAVPESIAASIEKTRGRYNFDELDEHLGDLAAKGKIAQMGLPNSFIWGAYYNGDLKLNRGFAPSFENAPPANKQHYGYSIEQPTPSSHAHPQEPHPSVGDLPHEQPSGEKPGDNIEIVQ